MSPQDAAEDLARRGLKVSWRTLHRARSRLPQAPAPTSPPPVPTDEDLEIATQVASTVDASADPLAILRALLDASTRAREKLQPDHPRYNALLTTAGMFTKGIAGIERERAKVETPEDAADRKRREAGEVRRLILETVEAEEKLAAERGVCAHCGGPLAGATK